MDPKKNAIYPTAMGGTEILREAVYKRLPKELLDKFNFILFPIGNIGKSNIGKWATCKEVSDALNLLLLLLDYLLV